MITPDVRPYLDGLIEHFGFPPDVFDAYAIWRGTKKYLMMSAADHAPPSTPEPASRGIPFMRTHLKYPKLTGGAAQLLGHHATRYVVDVDRARAHQFFRRETFTASEHEARRCPDSGYVLVRMGPHTLGVGFFQAGAAGGAVASLFPKHKALKGEGEETRKG